MDYLWNRAGRGGSETRQFTLALCVASGLLAFACTTDSPPGGSNLRQPAPSSDFRIIVHRGGGARVPENTLPAVRRSLAGGFTEVELDVQISLDDVLVLYHDHTLERKTGHEGSVGVYTAAELTRFELGSWFDREHPEVAESFAGTPIATLAEVFSEFGPRLYYHLEIKGEDPRIPEVLLQAIATGGFTDRVTVTSFLFDQLARFRSLSGEIPICWLLERNRDLAGEAVRKEDRLARQRAQVDVARRAGFSQVAISASEISAQIVDFAHANELGIRAWGVGSIEDERRVLASGSDGATTDWPERLRGRLSE